MSGHIERVFDICYYGDQVITCGVKHIRFWTLLGNTLQHKEGTFGKLEAQTLLCIGHFLESNQKNTDRNKDPDISCFTGAINGYIYVWKKYKIEKFIPGIDGVCITIDRLFLSIELTNRLDKLGTDFFLSFKMKNLYKKIIDDQLYELVQ